MKQKKKSSKFDFEADNNKDCVNLLLPFYFFTCFWFTIHQKRDNGCSAHKNILILKGII